MLESRGLITDNKRAALDYLERVGYYRLSGYWYNFRKMTGAQKRADEFIDSSYFEDAVKLYIFDKALRLLAMDALERIEMAVRVDIAYLLGKKDIYAHEKSELFFGGFSKQ